MSRKGSQKDRANKDFMAKPDEGWSHNTAALAVGKGVYYSFPVRYIGSIQILESLRGLDMSQKIKICWEAINRTCEAAKIKKTKKRKVDKTIAKYLADSPFIKIMELKINMSVEGIATSDLKSNEIISNDSINKISFASGGQADYYDFVTYVAKDKRDNRYCHIFDCSILADDVLATIGQIFNILTNKADYDDLVGDAKAVKTAGELDNPLYHAMAAGGKARARDGGDAAINDMYEEGEEALAIYDEAENPGQEKGEEFAQFLNENIASQPLYGEIADGEALYGEGAEPGWGYLDVKPDEDLYGGLADVFVDGDE